MKRRTYMFFYLFPTAAISCYIVFRLISLDPGKIKSVAISSRGGNAPTELGAFIAKEGRNSAELPDKIPVYFPSIEAISIRNNLNGTISAEVKMKKIIGLWSDGNTVYPLAEDGRHISRPAADEDAKGLILFKGPVGPNAADVAGIIGKTPALLKETAHLEYIENRRWNIILKSGATIWLPEHGISAAVAKIGDSGIIAKSFAILDLRDGARMLVK